MSNKHSLWFRLKRAFIFWAGDVRRLHCFPWVTWDVHAKNIDYAEALEALKVVRKGDVGVHRDDGFLSNLAIPGFCKHAWIHVADGDPVCGAEIVEAVSEGVLRRHALHPVVSDYVAILRPPPGTVTPEDVELACGYARRLVGCTYDVDFDFDLEKEHADLAKEDQKRFKDLHHLRLSSASPEDANFVTEAQSNLKQSFGSFSCTETAAFAWWCRRKELKIERKKYAGKDIIAADDYFNGFDIVWLSRKVTPHAAQKLGLPKSSVEKIADWCRKNRPAK